MALDDILRTMEEQTATDEERIRSKARAEAETLLADGRKRADDAFRREYDSLIAPLRAERMRIVNEARLALQSALQSRKQSLWQEVVAEARGRIEKHRGGSEYADTLTALIDEAAGRLGPSGDDIVVEVAAPDRQAAEAAVLSSSISGAKVSADGDLGTSLGGVALTTAGGGVRVLNTLDSRLDEVVGKEVAELATRLFGEG